MALNFGILQPVNIGGQFMAGQKQAQENQLAQQQAAMREQEMGMRQQEMGMRQQEATERTEDRATKLVNAAKRNEFLTKLSIQMEKGGHKLNRQTLSSMMNFGLQSNEDSLVKLAGEGLRALDEQDQFASIMGGGAPAAAPAIRPSVTPGAMGSGTFDPNAPAPVAPMNALAPTAEPVAPVNALAPTAGPDQAAVGEMRRKRDQLLAMGTTRSIAAANALDRDIALASKTSDTPEIVTMRALGYPPTQAGYQAYRDAQRQERMLTPAEEDQRVRIAKASRAAPTPATPSAPVAVVDPVTGKQVYVSREQAISGKMSPAAAMESLPPKEIQKREAALPQATTAVTGFEKKTDSFVKDLTALRDHPGLSEITGIAAGRMPGITASGRAAQALYDKVVAKGGFQALQDLRDASKTGGALGNVSNQEGRQLVSSFSAIDRRQDAADVRSALDQAIGDVQGARTRLREAYDMTYSYKGSDAPSPRSPGAAPAAAPAAGGKLSPTEQTELDALRKRFGK